MNTLAITFTCVLTFPHNSAKFIQSFYYCKLPKCFMLCRNWKNASICDDHGSHVGKTSHEKHFVLSR